jgi:hypothetical protein
MSMGEWRKGGPAAPHRAQRLPGPLPLPLPPCPLSSLPPSDAPPPSDPALAALDDVLLGLASPPPGEPAGRDARRGAAGAAAGAAGAAAGAAASLLAPPASALVPYGGVDSADDPFAPEPAPGDGGAVDAAASALAAALTFDRAAWEGPLPSSALAQWAASQRLPPPVYGGERAAAGRARASVTLGHAGVSLAPEADAATPEDAIEAAALLGVAYLEGGLPASLRGVAVARAVCGGGAAGASSASHVFQPHPHPTLDTARAVLEGGAASLARARRALDAEYAARAAPLDAAATRLAAAAAALDAGAATAEAVLRNVAADATLVSVARASEPPASSAWPPAPRARDPGAPPKNPVQELKEVCDRCRWPMPAYEFRGDGGGGFTCVARLASGGVPPLASPPAPSQKAAKAAAAARVLDALRASGAVQ